MMRNRTNPDLSTRSLDGLIRLALEDGLITDYRVSPGLATLYRRGRLVAERDPEEARRFLVRLLERHLPRRARQTADRCPA